MWRRIILLTIFTNCSFRIDNVEANFYQKVQIEASEVYHCAELCEPYANQFVTMAEHGFGKKYDGTCHNHHCDDPTRYEYENYETLGTSTICLHTGAGSSEICHCCCYGDAAQSLAQAPPAYPAPYTYVYGGGIGGYHPGYQTSDAGSSKYFR